VKDNKKTAKSVLHSLQQTRESCMLKLLSEDVVLPENFPDENLKVNPILKKIAPERQALTAEELIHLVRADELQQITSDEEIKTEEELSATPVEELDSNGTINGKENTS